MYELEAHAVVPLFGLDVPEQWDSGWGPDRRDAVHREPEFPQIQTPTLPTSNPSTVWRRTPIRARSKSADKLRPAGLSQANSQVSGSCERLADRVGMRG